MSFEYNKWYSTDRINNDLDNIELDVYIYYYKYTATPNEKGRINIMVVNNMKRQVKHIYKTGRNPDFFRAFGTYFKIRPLTKLEYLIYDIE